MTRKAAFTVKRAYDDGRVKIVASLSAWRARESVGVQASGEIPAAAARQLAADLIAEADRIDAKTAKKAAFDARRRAWRNREVAALPEAPSPAVRIKVE